MRLYRMYLLVALASLSAAAIAGLTVYGSRLPKTPSVVVTPSPAAVTAASAGKTTEPTLPAYVLSQWNGHLALFEGSNPYPSEVYDVYVRSFPEEERQRLATGIPAADEAALERLLEDYSG